MNHELKSAKINKELKRYGLIIQIKEMLGPLVCKRMNIDEILKDKTEDQLKRIIVVMVQENKKWQESKRRNNGKSR